MLSKSTSRALWADSACRSQANEEELAALGLCSHSHKKGQRFDWLTDHGTNRSQKLSNGPIPVNPGCEFEAFGKLSGSAELAEDRAVELVFGSMTNEQGGLYFRVIGLPAAGRARTASRIGLMNRVYNMRRLVQIDRLPASDV